MSKVVNEIGTIITKKKGQGKYAVIGHINCPRSSCNRVIELREQIIPNKLSRRNGYYWSEWSLCPHCGLYDNSLGKKVRI